MPSPRATAPKKTEEPVSGENEIVQINYIPNKRQAEFHSCGATEVVYGGAKGGGKSVALVMECLAYCLENAGATAYLFRESYDQLEANLIREWKSKVPRELYKYSETKREAVLLNGSKVYFRYMSNDIDAEGYQGREMDWIGVDELTTFSERSIQIVLSCMRSPKGFSPKFRGTCNPGGIGHTWVKAKYIDKTFKGTETYRCEITDNEIAFIPATVYDNTILMENDPAYVKRLENLPPAEKKAFLYGDWDIFEGQFFSEWTYAVHVIEPFEIPKHWRRYRTLDYGLDMLAVLWIAVDENKRAYVYKELHMPKLIISEAAKVMKSFTSKDEDIYATYAPPDMWNRRQETGKSFADIFREHGIILLRSNNRRDAGWLAVKEYLNIFEEEEVSFPTSMLKIFRNCKNLITNLPQLQFDKKNPNDAAKEPHEITHITDSLRYFAVMHSIAANAPIVEKPRLYFQKKRTQRAI